MVDIPHRVGVKTPSPAKVYDALTTVEGLAGTNAAPSGRCTC
jgi:hypothetical protein